ncbi:DUF3992 domain-containing protein [Anoxybacillus sp. LAT_35]|nr:MULTISPECIES: S-Ena type endospore appendage [unclassified Anoxybacillus]MCG6171100.1 DUF3992 domain-containing protein [Anoxybacillus sp. LAT_11]MCG6176132.1 DUF3992 domain-containing protein [Anoxybacillus sp. LAT_31]MCG6179017.1 DUF3992 domain-containing protein [Anoxybacillus sp. LAT_35]MCG6182759.1 DUF3992 domain-containing protein [Anoxybacillus sp. LAT_26]MCG6196951.1 DUF3992 domain-containing protein [Anoxybacillus sp. LAT_38]
MLSCVSYLFFITFFHRTPMHECISTHSMIYRMKRREWQVEKHCIHVEKVFDWVSRSVKLTKRETLTEPIVEHNICVNICAPCGEKTIVWSAEEHVHAFGTVTVVYEQGCGRQMDVLINGEIVCSLQEGESRSLTMSHLRDVHVECKGNGTCVGRVCIQLHQQLDRLDDCEHIRCILTDACGQPIVPEQMTCRVLDERQTVHVTLPNGKQVALQKIYVLVETFIVLQCTRKDGTVWKTKPISLATIEDVLLCAPPETDIVCETVVADCKAALLSTTCPQILISVHLCQHIQSLGRVKIEIEGTTCTPRVEQQVDICPPHHIPSCPI